MGSASICSSESNDRMSNMLDFSTVVRLAPASSDEIRARSRGRITRDPLDGDLYPRDRDGREVLVPEPGGFYDETLFGPLAAPEASAFAHLELRAALRHPMLDAPIDVVPVLPAAYRPYDDELGRDVTAAYGELYSVCARFARLIELDAPAHVVEDDRESCERALSALIDNRTSAEPVRVGAARRPRGSLADLLDTRDAVQLEAVLFAIGLRLVAL